MVALQSFKTEDVKTTGSSGVKIPDGKYRAVIIGSSMEKSLSAGKPDDLVLKVVITEGQFQNKELEHRLSIGDNTPINADKPDWTWSKAAYGNIGQIADALGMENTPTDSSMMHNKPLIIETGTKLGKDKETKAHKPEWDRSFIKSYHKVQSSGFAAPAATPTATPAAVGGTPAWAQQK